MICPQCANEVPVSEAQYLSMYTCMKCQAVYFIDIAGLPEFGDMSLPMPSEVVQLIEPASENLHLDIQSDILNEITNDLSIEIPEIDFTNQFNSDLNPFEAPEAHSEASRFGLAANEITDFANQDNSISALSYDLKITGLDTKEMMILFKEALEDSKFGWIAQDIFLTIKNGECELKDLNPIQAFVLAKRIQFLDIETKWSQNVQV